MPACERCWSDSGGDADAYQALIKTQTCTPAQQAGPDATMCLGCGHRTVHQYAKVCMTCHYVAGDTQP